jgi:DNA-directed RNA polymerase specialized sigma24 family protein
MSTVETSYIYTEKSFRYLFDRFKSQLYGFVLGIVQQPPVAEKITIDIFLGLWLCRDTLPEMSDLDEYIFMTACNKTLGQMDMEGTLPIPMRSLWEESKIQLAEYPVSWDTMNVWMNQGEGAEEERWTPVWIVRLIALAFLLMAAALAYFSITMK